MHILIISISNFKNLLLTDPLMRAIKVKYPEAQVHFATAISNKYYIEKIPHISNAYYIAGDAIPVIFELLKYNFSFIIDLEESHRSYLIKHNLKNKYGSTVKIFSYPAGILRSLFAKSKAYAVNYLSTAFMGVCKPLALVTSAMDLKYYVTDADALQKDDIPTSHKLGFVCVNLDNLPLTEENLVQFCTDLNYPITLVGDGIYYELGEKLKSVDFYKIYNACGKYSQAETYHLFAHSKVVVSAENIGLYQAAAAKKPLLYVGALNPALWDIMQYSNFNPLYFKRVPSGLKSTDLAHWLTN
jgi:ADP-heptose:LPS heptosyltransferase